MEQCTFDALIRWCPGRNLPGDTSAGERVNEWLMYVYSWVRRHTADSRPWQRWDVVSCVGVRQDEKTNHGRLSTATTGSSEEHLTRGFLRGF